MHAHPLCLLMPVMRHDEYKALKLDIKEHGLLSPIVLFEGKVLDGRHRQQACDELGIKPKTTQFKGSYDEAAAYVMSHNLHRRHLKPSQGARVAADLEEHFADRARERQRAGGAAGGKGKGKANLPEASQARDQAAGLLGVSGRSVSAAKRVKRRGTAKLDDALKAGKVSVSAAAKAAELPPEQQDEAVDMVERGKERSLTAAVRRVSEAQDKAEHVGDATVTYAKPGAPWYAVAVGGQVVGHVVKRDGGWRAYPITETHADREAAVLELVAGRGGGR